MTVTEVCMFFITFFLTVWVWRLTDRTRELELHSKALWETNSRLWEEIASNKKRIVTLELSDGNDSESVLPKKVEEAMRNSIMC